MNAEQIPLRGVLIPAVYRPDANLSPHPWGRVWIRSDGTATFDPGLIDERSAHAMVDAWLEGERERDRRSESPMPTGAEIDAARERALDAYFARPDASTASRPAEAFREAFRAGWQAALYAALPQRYVLGNVDLDAALEPVTDGLLPYLPPGPRRYRLGEPIASPPTGGALAGPQLRALADRIRRSFPPPSIVQPPQEYVRNEAMMVLAEGLDDLAHAEDEQ